MCNFGGIPIGPGWSWDWRRTVHAVVALALIVVSWAALIFFVSLFVLAARAADTNAPAGPQERHDLGLDDPPAEIVERAEAEPPIQLQPRPGGALVAADVSRWREAGGFMGRHWGKILSGLVVGGYALDRTGVIDAKEAWDGLRGKDDEDEDYDTPATTTTAQGPGWKVETRVEHSQNVDVDVNVTVNEKPEEEPAEGEAQ